jgi:hypothetical protein
MKVREVDKSNGNVLHVDLRKESASALRRVATQLSKAGAQVSNTHSKDIKAALKSINVLL